MPFCPKCGTEYYEGYAHCSRCGEKLGERLPEGETPDWTRQEYRKSAAISDRMRGVVGNGLRIIAFIMWALVGLAGFIIELWIVHDAAGFWGIVLGITLLPAVFLAAPWYALFAWGDWLPLVVVYGGGIGATVLFVVGSAVAGD